MTILAWIGVIWLIGSLVFFVAIRLEAQKQEAKFTGVQLAVACIWFLWIPWYLWLIVTEKYDDWKRARVA